MLDGLDRWQLAAATAPGNLLVLAGPGSGKTTLLAARAKHLLGTGSGRLCAVSFTRDSARELAARIGDSDRLVSGTFHSIAMRQRPGKAKILDEAGRLHYVRRAIEEAGFSITLDNAIAYIDRVKASLSEPPTSGEEAAVFRAYQQHLKRHQLRDFQDLLLDSVRGMRARSIAPLQIEWLLVDEAQDIDEVQFAWMMEHVAAGVETTLVADDDQSIYGWRHALGYEGLTRFEAQAKAKRHVLAGNYRCGSEIVVRSQHVIRNNAQRYDKVLRAQRGVAGAIEVSSFGSKAAEADAVTSEVASDPGSWGVLARTNRRLDQVELACAAAGVPYFRLGGGSFWDHPVAAAMLACCGDLTTSGSLSGMERAAVFVDGASRADIGAVHAGKRPEHKGLRQLLALWPEWSQLESVGRTQLALRGMMSWTEKWYEDRAKPVAGMACAHLLKLSGSLPARLSWVRRSLDRSRKADSEPKVTLSSLHSAKGLEWKQVWMVGCEDGVLPHVDAPLDEERRLYYVGMTRARDRLVISYSLYDAVPSRFISEMNG